MSVMVVYVRFFRSLCPRLIGVALLFLIGVNATSLTAQDRPNAAVEKKPAKQTNLKVSPLKGTTKDFNGYDSPQFDLLEPNPLTKKFYQPKLTSTYFYGNADKETVPVLMLHGKDGSRDDLRPLADALAKQGYGVLLPDLRGHGKSNQRFEVTYPQFDLMVSTQTKDNGPRGRTTTKKEMVPVIKTQGSIKLISYNENDVVPQDFLMIMKNDMPLYRDSLLDLHEAGYVNMNQSVIIGVGRSAALAAGQAVNDWKTKDDDKFTKTLVLIAPEDIDPRFDTSKLFENLKPFRDNVSILFVIPEGSANDTLVEKIRGVIIGKEKDTEVIAARLPVFRYAPKEPNMPVKQVLESKDTKVLNSIVTFLQTRKESFQDKNRWSKL